MTQSKINFQLDKRVSLEISIEINFAKQIEFLLEKKFFGEEIKFPHLVLASSLIQLLFVLSYAPATIM